MDEAAAHLETAAFAALMTGCTEDLARMGACTDALSALHALGARCEGPLGPINDSSGALIAAVATLREIDPDAFGGSYHAAVVCQIADDLQRWSPAG